MLSGETAGGKYPIHACKVMSKICFEAERIIDFKKIYQAISSVVHPNTEREMLASLCCQSALDLDSSIIICFTETGKMP